MREAEIIEKPEKKENLEKSGLVEAAELKSSAPDNEEKTHKSSEDKIQKASDGGKHSQIQMRCFPCRMHKGNVDPSASLLSKT